MFDSVREALEAMVNVEGFVVCDTVLYDYLEQVNEASVKTDCEDMLSDAPYDAKETHLMIANQFLESENAGFKVVDVLAEDEYDSDYLWTFERV